jgi:hypothetical protein
MQPDLDAIERTHEPRQGYTSASGGVKALLNATISPVVAISIPCTQPYVQHVSHYGSIFVYVEHVLANGTGYVEVTLWAI